MIKPEEFYTMNEYPGPGEKKKLWKRVKNSIPDRKSFPLFYFDTRSFAFGFGSAVFVLFFCMGVYTLFAKLAVKDEPAYVKINNAYSKAVDEVEKSIPHLTTASYNKSYNLDEVLKAGKSKLNSIDAGISEIKAETGQGDYSPVRQSRLRELYKMKLEILSRMIDMEENGL